jgi:ribonucleoside-diphosphate reductase alpha chain
MDKSKITSVDIVNIINIPNTYNFTQQAIAVKKAQIKYRAKMVICDGNGLGAGLIDKLLEEAIDPATGESLGCWDTINDNNTPEIANSPKKLYNLKAQSYQNEIVTTFIDYVESGKLKLLERKLDSDFTENDWNDFDTLIRPYVETDALIEEAANLKLKHLNGGSVTIEQATKRVDKDRVSALIYMLWYVDNYAKDLSEETQYSVHTFVN